ncbi:MAG: thiol protease/hemagglutinin PrtT [Bacteroidota bacterium]
MKKIFLTVGILVFATTSIFAKKVDEATAKKVGANFLIKNIDSQSLKSASDLQLIYNGKDLESKTTFYVFNAEQDGFVIISGDDVVKPVLAYSDQGAFDPNDMAPATKAWLESYSNQISEAVKNNYKSTAAVDAQWNEYITGNINKIIVPTVIVAPLIKTQWNQGTYYNSLCPGGSVTGCVATAMAQILKYWNSPTKGIGSHTYSDPLNNDANGNAISGSAYGNQTANFGATTYAWSSMPNKLTATSTSAQKTAVATLMYHCGVSIDMNYSVQGSGASTTSVPEAIESHFKYSTEAQYVSRVNYSYIDWVALLKSELNSKRPVQYRGDSTGGHSFICDGYNSWSLFHFNWGWGGSNDGYFNLDALTPGGYSFNNHQGAVVRIYPLQSISGSYQFLKSSSHAFTIDSPFPLTNSVKWTLTSGKGFSFSPTSVVLTKTVSATSSVTVYAPSYISENAILTVENTTGNLIQKLTKTIKTVNFLTIDPIIIDPIIIDPIIVYPNDPIIRFEGTTDVTESTENKALSFYPNPANAEITIDVPASSKIEILNIKGQVLRMLEASEGATKVNISDLSKGMYFIRANTNNEITMKKFIKE